MEREESWQNSEPDVVHGCTQKLLEGERVEVRMKEKGLRGSWHPAVVLKTLSGKRQVEYEQLCAKNGTLLTETVRVGPAVDGEMIAPRLRKKATVGAEDRRLSIRPIPPPTNIPVNMWQAGAAVESFYNDAWWEGYLVTDAPDDIDATVKVVYPDEPQFGVEPVALRKLRLGQDWNEETGNWTLKMQAQIDPKTGLLKGPCTGGSRKKDKQDLALRSTLAEPTTPSKPVQSCACACLDPNCPAAGHESRRSDPNCPAARRESGRSDLDCPAAGRESGRSNLDCPAPGPESGRSNPDCPAAGPESGRSDPDSNGKGNLESLGDAKKKRGRPRKNPLLPVESSRCCHASDAIASGQENSLELNKKEAGEMMVDVKSTPHLSASAVRQDLQVGVEAADAVQKQPGRKSKAKKVFPEEEGKDHLCTTKQKVLRRIIDAGIFDEGTPVTYSTEKHNLKGLAFRGGVLCSCCNEVLSVSVFEAHAKSTLKRPSANIYLEDGRSLQECLREADISKSSEQTGEMKDVPEEEIDYSDDLCRLCGDGGELICCESCPVTFHLECIGLDSVPDGDWFCPACRCAICGGSDFDPEFSDKTVVLCDQCEREYHVGCMNQEGMPVMKALPEGNWFCSRQCELISEELRALVGKQLPLEDGYSWTLLQCPEGPPSDDGLKQNNINEALKLLPAKQAKKMRLGLKVMHECFNPIHDPRTQEDLIPSIVNNRRTRYADFSRFYTALLERDDDLITVATIRVFGSYLAEMPLIGTRFEYRRKGMCRRLMNAVEELLANLGVVRMVLPAVAEVKDTWRSGFGFQDIPETQKRRLAEVGILVFPGTTTLQKPITLQTPEVHVDRRQLRAVRGRVLAACVHPSPKKGKLPSALSGGFRKLNGTLPGQSLLAPVAGTAPGSVELPNNSPDRLATDALVEDENKFEALKDAFSFQADVTHLPTAALGMSNSVRVRPDGIVVDLDGMRLSANCWAAAAAKLKRKGIRAEKKTRRKESELRLAAQGPLPGARTILPAKEQGLKAVGGCLEKINGALGSGVVDKWDGKVANGKVDQHSPGGSEERLLVSGNKRKPDDAGSSPDESRPLLSGRTRSRQVKMPERFRDANMEVTMNRGKPRTSEELALEMGGVLRDDQAASKKLQAEGVTGNVADVSTGKSLTSLCTICQLSGEHSWNCPHKSQLPLDSASPDIGRHFEASKGVVNGGHERGISHEVQQGQSARPSWNPNSGKRGPEMSPEFDGEEDLRKKQRRTMVDVSEGYGDRMAPSTVPEFANEAKRRKVGGEEGWRQQLWANGGLGLGGSTLKDLQCGASEVEANRLLEPHRSNLAGFSMLEVRLSPKVGEDGAERGQADLRKLMADFRGSGGIPSREGHIWGSIRPNGMLNGSRGQESNGIGKQLEEQRERQREMQRPVEGTFRQVWMSQHHTASVNRQPVHAVDTAVLGSYVGGVTKPLGSQALEPTVLGKRYVRTGEEGESGMHSAWGGVMLPADGVWESRIPHKGATGSSKPSMSFGTSFSGGSGFRSTTQGAALNGSGGQAFSRPSSDQRFNFTGVSPIRHGGLPGAAWAKRGVKTEGLPSRAPLFTDIARACAVPLKLSKASAVGKARAVEKLGLLEQRQLGGPSSMATAMETTFGVQQGTVMGFSVSSSSSFMASGAARKATSDVPGGVPVISPSLSGKVGNASSNGFTGNGGSFPSRVCTVSQIGSF